MLAMPGNFVRSRPVQSETEWRFVLPHLSHHTVSPSQFFGKTVSVKCFCRDELDLGMGVVGLHQACGMHLDTLDNIQL